MTSSETNQKFNGNEVVETERGYFVDRFGNVYNKKGEKKTPIFSKTRGMMLFFYGRIISIKIIQFIVW